ncbi:MAG: aminodeoxychorismate synthase component I [Sulfurospirillum cavolei]|nr:aminodeoxychorismate synthase component I [Sulfurospirillum cavolei]
MPIEFVQTLNRFGQQRTPFFFVVDYNIKQFYAQALQTLDPDILYALDAERPSLKQTFTFEKSFPDFHNYLRKIEAVQEAIRSGNTYLLNLTAPTLLRGDLDLRAIFYAANAPFKLCFKDRFVCFSPERFVKIENDCIMAYPMKGTIDASIDNAKERILNDEKEKAEHVMVVDLLRNDLARVATNVHVKRFRYVEAIQAGEKELLHVSSHISASLEPTWHDRIGEIIADLLPAGSISGTPKRKSVELIEQIEGYERGFFTGIFGVYDAKGLDSAVMIRFIEKNDEGFVYKSGGGITLLSDPLKEYEEVCHKVYIPVL